MGTLSTQSRTMYNRLAAGTAVLITVANVLNTDGSSLPVLQIEADDFVGGGYAIHGGTFTTSVRYPEHMRTNFAETEDHGIVPLRMVGQIKARIRRAEPLRPASIEDDLGFI